MYPQPVQMCVALPIALVYRRTLKLKANFESGS